jgi:1-acyl-sn-glycerol-3-phosphate acyltransferase
LAHTMENILLSLRSGVRFPLVLLWTAAIWSVRLAFWPIGWWSEALDRRGRRWIMRVWGEGFRRIVGMALEVHGPLPKPPYYLVANHLGYLDIFTLATVLGCTFVARGDLAHWPIIGWVSRSLHVLFINREQRQDAVRVNTLIAHTLAERDGLVVFAESRISCGLAVEPFKSALIQPAIDNGLPVHYVTINYSTPNNTPRPSDVVGWWRPEGFFFHVRRLLRYPGFKVTLHFGDEPIAGADRKTLAAALHEAVKAKYVPFT